GLEDVSLGSLKISMDIENVKITDEGVDVRVKRNSGEANLVGLNFIVSDGEDSEVFEVETNMKELATQTFNLDYTGFPESVEIAPILANEEGREKIYNSIDKYENSIRKDLEELGIVSWWSFNGNAEDEIGENNGELFGDVNCNVQGSYGRACEFDGDDDYILIEDNKELDTFNGEVSFSFWVKPTSFESLTTASAFLSKRLSNYNGFFIFAQTGTSYLYWDWGNSESRLNTGFAIPIGEWNHIILSKDDNERHLYVNGELYASISNTGDDSLAVSSSDLYIGKDIYPSSGYYYNGLLDEIMIFDKALTKEQVKWLYEEDLS
ncbi:MAG: LamG domain-containing protein, partial [Candidatus Pacearchaeota archaeon]|nr:LamG domain-containing protein [Candidatus Pacearchaeota archaeon]